MTLPSTQYPLLIEGLTKRYGHRAVIDSLTFTVEPGRITGFLGPNGSGKSTTMKVLLDLAAADHGTATIGGSRYRDLPDPAGTVGVVLEPNAFHPGRSGRNHLRIIAEATGQPVERVDETLAIGRPRPGARPTTSRHLLARHEAAALAGCRTARRPPGAGTRRTRQRARPPRHPRPARPPAGPGRSGPHRAGLQPPAHRGGAAGRGRGRHQRRPPRHHRADRRPHRHLGPGPHPVLRSLRRRAHRRRRHRPTDRGRHARRHRTRSRPRSATSPTQQVSPSTSCLPMPVLSRTCSSSSPPPPPRKAHSHDLDQPRAKRVPQAHHHPYAPRVPGGAQRDRRHQRHRRGVRHRHGRLQGLHLDRRRPTVPDGLRRQRLPHRRSVRIDRRGPRVRQQDRHRHLPQRPAAVTGALGTDGCGRARRRGPRLHRGRAHRGRRRRRASADRPRIHGHRRWPRPGPCRLHAGRCVWRGARRRDRDRHPQHRRRGHRHGGRAAHRTAGHRATRQRSGTRGSPPPSPTWPPVSSVAPVSPPPSLRSSSGR